MNVIALLLVAVALSVVISAYIAYCSMREALFRSTKMIRDDVNGCRERLEFLIAGITMNGMISPDFKDYLEFASKYVDLDQINRSIKGIPKEHITPANEHAAASPTMPRTKK